MAKSMKHLHTYQRVKTGVYRCLHPDCSHYSKVEFIRGKRASCICGKSFLLTKEALRLKNPHCETCGKSYHKKQEQHAVVKSIVISDILSNMLSEGGGFGVEDRPELDVPDEMIRPTEAGD